MKFQMTVSSRRHFVSNISYFTRHVVLLHTATSTTKQKLSSLKTLPLAILLTCTPILTLYLSPCAPSQPKSSTLLRIFTTSSQHKQITIHHFKMGRTKTLVFLLSLFVILHVMNSMEEDEKRALTNVLRQLSGDKDLMDPKWGNMSTDPCLDGWKGVICPRPNSFKKLVLDDFNLTGTLDTKSLCQIQSIQVLSLNNNNIHGEVGQEIGNCRQLTHFLLSTNKLSGVLPEALSSLNNLKQFDISNNDFSGEVPNMARISGLVSFLAENNKLIGEIPNFDYSNLQIFNVSNNNFTGEVPDLKGHFTVSSLIGNPGLCGGLLSKPCPPSSKKKGSSKGHSVEHVLMFSGYIVIGLIVLAFIAFKLIYKDKKPTAKTEVVEKSNNGASLDASANKLSTTSVEHNTGAGKSDYSINSGEQSAMMSTSMVVLSSPVAKGLRFEDLLKAPAELLGRGKHSTAYKVILEDGGALAVKRIKDWVISGDDFKRRMQYIDQAKHHSVMPAVAFYSSKQEKLLVYKYQQNGSLLELLQRTQNGESFFWTSRLSVAASIAEAVAFMHKELQVDGIGHGNLKSSNILFDQNMDPLISEYGLMVVENNQGNTHSLTKATGHINMNDKNFKIDMHGFGVILLELLTGRLGETDGLNLAKWVHSVLREEWTVEVFDKNLIKEGSSEQGMVNLLQVAVKCIDPSPEARPNMSEVAAMINTIKEEEDSSMVSEV